MFKRVVVILLILSLVTAVGLKQTAVVSPLSWRFATDYRFVNQFGIIVRTVDCRALIEIEGVRKEVSVSEGLFASADWRICKMKTRPETIEVDYLKIFRFIIVLKVEV